METRWLSPQELAGWTRLAALFVLLPNALDTQLQRDARLTHFEYRSLAIISEAAGRAIELERLARATNTDVAVVFDRMQGLEERGFVQIAEGPDDEGPDDEGPQDEASTEGDIHRSETESDDSIEATAGPAETDQPETSHEDTARISLTAAGWAKIQNAAPGHVRIVRELVIDALTPEQIDQLAEIAEQILGRLDEDEGLHPVYARHLLPKDRFVPILGHRPRRPRHRR